MNGEPEIERKIDMAKDTKAATDNPNPTTPDQGVTGTFVAPEATAPKPAAAPAPKTMVLVEEAGKRMDKEAISLLLAACEKFGVNPEAECRPQELKAWRYAPADPLEGVPAYVALVTMGGLKIRHYADPDYMAPGCLEPAMDQDTEDRLRRVFGAFDVDPKTKDVTPAPFPKELTLPAAAVDGRVRSVDHRYGGGYLRAGGKTEAAKRGR